MKHFPISVPGLSRDISQLKKKKTEDFHSKYVFAGTLAEPQIFLRDDLKKTRKVAAKKSLISTEKNNKNEPVGYQRRKRRGVSY